MRQSVIDDIIEASNFRNELNQPLYTVVVGFLFSDERKYLEDQFKVTKIGNTSYNLITFNKNFKL